MKIIVTGSNGHLGGRIARHLKAEGHEITGFDLTAADEPVTTHAADLSRFDAAWVDLLRGQDVIVHLAASRDPYSPFDAVIPNNIDATLNLFEAARQAGVKRVVFASSNWVVGGYRFRETGLGAGTTPFPVSPYGMSKLMGERIGAHYAAVHGLTVIAARIGWTQWTHDNIPGPHMSMGRWGQLMWLSDRDFLGEMTAAATVPLTGFHIVNFVSNNPGMRWSLQELRETLGYEPLDGAAAQLPLSVRLKEFGAWLRVEAVPGLMARMTGQGW